MKKEDNKRKKAKRDNLSDNEKDQMKKEDNKRKKAKHDNLSDNEKEKGGQQSVITSMLMKKNK